MKLENLKNDNTYLVYFSSYSLIYSKQVSMTTRKYVEISCSDLDLPTDGIYLMQKSDIFIGSNCEKEDLRSRIFCPKNSQLCCVMMTKDIFGSIYALHIIFLYGHNSFICRITYA